MQYRIIIMPLVFPRCEKDERNLTALSLPIFRKADPEDNVQFNAGSLDYCPHTILGESRKVLHSLYGLAKLAFASIRMVFVYKINRICILKTLRKSLIFLGAVCIFCSLLTLSQGLFFSISNFTLKVEVPFAIWFAVWTFARAMCRPSNRLPLIFT